eukprot:93153-Rhodomonas_salina.2
MCANPHFQQILLGIPTVPGYPGTTLLEGILFIPAADTVTTKLVPGNRARGRPTSSSTKIPRSRYPGTGLGGRGASVLT